MSRNFDGVIGTDNISLGDIDTAECLRDDTWTVLAFFRVEETEGDDRSIMSKGQDWDTNSQYWWYIKSATAPTGLRFSMNDYAIKTTSGDVIQPDTWYMAAVTNDGLNQADSVNQYVCSMAGTVLDTSSSAHAGDNATLTEATRIGTSGSLIKDVIDGDIAYVSYFTVEFTQQQVLEYLHQPARVAARNRANCEYFLPLNGSSPEVDWSGQGKASAASPR